jgi:hypothetical protein
VVPADAHHHALLPHRRRRHHRRLHPRCIVSPSPMIRRFFSCYVARISNRVIWHLFDCLFARVLMGAWPVGSSAQIISPYHLYLNPKLVVQQYEIWRLVTNFLYFRKMGMCSLSLPLPWPASASARRCDVMSELYVG